jgi:thymidine kinase
MTGKFSLVLGSMKSGKSSFLIDKADRAKYRHKKVCIVRPSTDTREFISRTKNINVDIIQYPIPTGKTFDILSQYDIILFDECQFVKDLGILGHGLALDGKEVWAAGLNGDSDMHSWPEISEAIPYADNIKRISGVCENCGNDESTFSWYDGKKDKIEIGDGKYRALCRSCWEKLTVGSDKVTPPIRESGV